MFRKIFDFTIEFPRNAIIEFKIEPSVTHIYGLAEIADRPCRMQAWASWEYS